jgi:hypothetical protein
LINNAGTESKYGLKLFIPNSIGIIGSVDGESVFAETKLRLEVINVGPTFTLDIEGQIKNSPNWYVISTLTGAITGTLDISTYDRIRYKVTNPDKSGSLFASGFIPNANPFKFQSPDGELIVTGSMTPSGLRTGMLVTNLTITDVASALPLVSLASRNSMIFENRGAFSIFFGNSNVTASGANQGWELIPNASYSVDITDTIIIYAIAPVGQTVNVKVMEYA